MRDPINSNVIIVESIIYICGIISKNTTVFLSNIVFETEKDSIFKSFDLEPKLALLNFL